MLVPAASSNKSWRLPKIALCLLVFLFAFHAKTAVYGSGSIVKVSPSTSAKLWLSGQKLPPDPISQSGTLLLWVSVMLIGMRLQNRESLVTGDMRVVPLRHPGLQDLHRSLRPPPLG